MLLKFTMKNGNHWYALTVDLRDTYKKETTNEQFYHEIKQQGF